MRQLSRNLNQLQIGSIPDKIKTICSYLNFLPEAKVDYLWRKLTPLKDPNYLLPLKKRNIHSPVRKHAPKHYKGQQFIFTRYQEIETDPLVI